MINSGLHGEEEMFSLMIPEKEKQVCHVLEMPDGSSRPLILNPKRRLHQVEGWEGESLLQDLLEQDGLYWDEELVPRGRAPRDLEHPKANKCFYS